MVTAADKALQRAILEEIIQLGPHRLCLPELLLRIAMNPDDGVEVEEIRHAVRELRCDGLVRYRNDDEIAEPTRAAVRSHDLFTT